MHKIIQIFILIYIIGYVMVWKQGYQDIHSLSSSVVTKVKGVGMVLNRNDLHRKLWDVNDLVLPPEERKATFLTTNVVVTRNQTQSKCPEDIGVSEARCDHDSQCVKGKQFMLGNGVATGRCVNGRNNSKTCEIEAWCPVENDSIIKYSEPLLANALDFTLFIRNTIIFDELEVRRSNLFLWETNQIPTHCLYNAEDPFLKYCPIFKFSTIVGKINAVEKYKLLKYGGVFQVIITWICNLDYSVKHCKPEFTFNRLDYKGIRKSKGWNFRYATYYEKEGKEYRVLYKLFGLRIMVEVRGKAAKFSIITFTMNLGSSLALLAGAALFCDFIIMYLLPNSQSYFNSKVERLEDDDAFEEDTEYGSTDKIVK